MEPRLRLGDAHVTAGRKKRDIRTWEEGYRHLGHPAFLRRIVATHRPDDDSKARRQAASAMLACGRIKEGDPAPIVMAAALYFEGGDVVEAKKWLETASAKAVAPDREDSGHGEEMWVEVVMGLLEARGKLEAGDRLAAESAFQKVAQEASRKILGEPDSGYIVQPVEPVSSGN